MPRTFDPWIGPRYESEGLNGLKLLILGESHYGDFETEDSGFTQKVVGSQGRGQRHRFFTTTAKVVLGRGKDSISDEELADFWDRMAFANYIQEFVTESAESRKRPTGEMWKEAREPFLRTLAETEPDALLVLGKGLSRRLAELPDSLPSHAIKHPARYFKYDDWQPGVQDFLASARDGEPA